jgi:hypothetical protein
MHKSWLPDVIVIIADYIMSIRHLLLPNSQWQMCGMAFLQQAVWLEWKEARAPDTKP